ncbi:hypothetical protein BaRGS_00014343, partial [Batillaria attramentaria]
TELDGLQNPKGSAKAKKRSPLKKMLAGDRLNRTEDLPADPRKPWWRYCEI